jgi:hypothetical protein
MSSPAAPMSPSETDGFTVNKKIETIIKQNFKMLLLTMPGERVMDPVPVGNKNTIQSYRDRTNRFFRSSR